APRIRFELVVLAIIEDGPSPRLERDLVQRGFAWILILFAHGRCSRRRVRNRKSPSGNVPQATLFANRGSPIHGAVGQARCRFCWGRGRIPWSSVPPPCILGEGGVREYRQK